MSEYSKSYEIRWSDLDANGHVNYAAYINATGDLRFQFFSEHGFPPEKFMELGISPTFTSLQAGFLREVRMGETVTIHLAVSGLSSSGTHWKVHHDIFKANGKKAVTVDLEGTILNLATRKPAALSEELLQVFHLIPRTKDFEVLPEFGRRGSRVEPGRMDPIADHHENY